MKLGNFVKCTNTLLFLQCFDTVGWAVVGCWRGYLSGATCRFAYGPADATATHCLLIQ